MKKPTMTLAEVRRLLAAQDEQLRAAYAAVDSGKPVPVEASTLQALAEMCTTGSASHGAVTRTKWNAVRC